MQDEITLEALAPLMGQGWIEDILYEVKSGKEATVLCCRGGERARGALVAAKVYRPLEQRNFRNDDIYRAGRLVQNTRFKRAVDSRTEFGRKVHFQLWLNHEVEMLTRLAEAGLPVPLPLACADSALVMPYVGDAQSAAAPLHLAEMNGADDTARVADTLLDIIADMLDLHVVHADLSPYNVLYWQQEPIVIDFPQAVDPRLNPAAPQLLHRDLTNICEWATKNGAPRNADVVFEELWHDFVEGAIG